MCLCAENFGFGPKPFLFCVCKIIFRVWCLNFVSIVEQVIEKTVEPSAAMLKTCKSVRVDFFPNAVVPILLRKRLTKFEIQCINLKYIHLSPTSILSKNIHKIILTPKTC